MNCPVCSSAMITLELNEVEVDTCLDCFGIWLDSGELQLLINDPRQSQRLINSFKKVNATPSEGVRPCPICDKRMDKIRVGAADTDLQLDRCPRGHGLWFDKGELKDILERAHLHDDNRIKDLLADMFGHKHSS